MVSLIYAQPMHLCELCVITKSKCLLNLNLIAITFGKMFKQGS